jgi:putative ABC transport system permease protein
METLASYWNLFPVTLAQSLLYGFIALGIMIPFRILNFPDLTSEGSFPLGACLCAALIVAGVHPGLAMACAVAAGFAAGCVTAAIHLKLRVNTLLAGILVLTMLWSINLRIMGKSNIPLFAHDNLFDLAWPGFTADIPAQNMLWVVVVLGALWLLLRFLGTEIGLAARAVGANETMARAQGIDVARYTLLGVGAASAVTAFAGASVAQIQGYADVGMGFGMLINGLAALIIGETIVGRSSVLRQVAAPFIGSIVYYQVISFGLAAGVHPSDLKLVTALFVLAAIAIPVLRGRAKQAEPRRLGPRQP